MYNEKDLHSLFLNKLAAVWLFEGSSHSILDNEMRLVVSHNIYSFPFEFVTNGYKIDPAFLSQLLTEDQVASINLLSQFDVINKKGRFLYLNKHRFKNYYHFLFDYIPRILEAKKTYGNDFSVISFELTRWQKSILEKVGLIDIDIVVTNAICKMEEVVFVNTTMSGQYFPSAFEFYKKMLKSSLVSPTRKLYLHRKNNGNRKITNESDIIEMLNRYNFEIIDPSEYEFGEQVKIFSEALVVVGASGAAFSNLVFCQPSASVIDIFPENSYAPNFWKIFSAESNISYHGVKMNLLKQGVLHNINDSEFFISKEALLDVNSILRSIENKTKT